MERKYKLNERQDKVSWDGLEKVIILRLISSSLLF